MALILLADFQVYFWGMNLAPENFLNCKHSWTKYSLHKFMFGIICNSKCPINRFKNMSFIKWSAVKIYTRDFHRNFASGNWNLMEARLCSTVTSILIHFPVFTPTLFPACLYSFTRKNLIIQYFDALGIQFILDFKHSSMWS